MADDARGCELILLRAGTDEKATLALLRQATGLGRAEASGLLANLPQPIGGGWTRGEAVALRRRFEEAGATVALR